MHILWPIHSFIMCLIKVKAKKTSKCWRLQHQPRYHLMSQFTKLYMKIWSARRWNTCKKCQKIWKIMETSTFAQSTCAPSIWKYWKRSSIKHQLKIQGCVKVQQIFKKINKFRNSNHFCSWNHPVVTIATFKLKVFLNIFLKTDIQ